MKLRQCKSFRKFDDERYVASPIKCLEAVISRPQEGYIAQCTWYTVELKRYIYIYIYIYIYTHIYTWLKRYIFKRKRLFAWSSTIQWFMAAVRAIALQLCRRSNWNIFQILPLYRDYRNNRQYYRLFFFLRSTVILQKGGVWTEWLTELSLW